MPGTVQRSVEYPKKDKMWPSGKGQSAGEMSENSLSTGLDQNVPSVNSNSDTCLAFIRTRVLRGELAEVQGTSVSLTSREFLILGHTDAPLGPLSPAL